MRRLFVLGLARSGTTFLSHVLALTTSRIRFVMEPMPRVEGLRENDYVRPWFVKPEAGSEDVEHTRAIFDDLDVSTDRIRDGRRDLAILREDDDPEILIVKEVHGLVAFPAILQGQDCRVVAITRDTLRSLDSHFSGRSKQVRTYLLDEYDYIADYVRTRPERKGCEALEAALGKAPEPLVRYFGRPRSLTTELGRQACVTELLRLFLLDWAERDDRVVHVRHEDLCVRPLEEARRLYEFLDLDHDDSLVEGIEKLTRGKKDEKYGTEKDSLAVLSRPYRFLNGWRRWRVERIIGSETGWRCG